MIYTRLLEHDPLLRIAISTCAKSALEELHSPVSWFRIFIDLSLPDCEGLELVRHCERMGLIKCCTVVTASNNPLWIAEIKRIGALGFIKKNAPLEEMNNALASVLDGKPVFQASSSDLATRSACPLTKRHVDILCLLRHGFTSKKIASHLGLSPGTVDNHVTNLVRALNASGRMHAVAKAIELGYLAVSPSVNPPD